MSSAKRVSHFEIGSTMSEQPNIGGEFVHNKWGVFGPSALQPKATATYNEWRGAVPLIVILLVKLTYSTILFF